MQNPETTQNGGEGDTRSRLNELKAKLPGTENADPIGDLNFVEETIVRRNFPELKEGDEGLSIEGDGFDKMNQKQKTELFAKLRENIHEFLRALYQGDSEEEKGKAHYEALLRKRVAGLNVVVDNFDPATGVVKGRVKVSLYLRSGRGTVNQEQPFEVEISK